ncbi:MAG: MnhB domain-containing protein [Candidatus Hydrothermarchaeales archaeon]
MEDVIVRTVTRMMTPLIQMFGLYIIFHGHLTPGGGFQGGAVIGGSMILIAVVFGLKEGNRRAPHDLSVILESFALGYAIIGLLGILLGGNFLANKIVGIPVGTPGALLSGGIILGINIVIGFKVASTGKTLFYTIVEERPE